MRNSELLYKGIEPYTLLDRQRFLAVCTLLNETLKLEGDIAELGVYKGGTAVGMALSAPQKTIHLFDTFAGLQAPKYEERHKEGDFADTSVDAVLALFLTDHSVKLHVGWFPETITNELQHTTFCFVHVDGDYYETIRDAINFFYPRLSIGGILVFDDWKWRDCPGVEKALLECQSHYSYEIIESKDYFGCPNDACLAKQAFIRKTCSHQAGSEWQQHCFL